MSEDAVVLSVLRRLESLGLDYMLVGSYASNLWGRPRSSYDADVVIAAGPEDAERLAAAFSDEFVVDAGSIRRDLERGTMFKVIPERGIFKVDLIPVRNSAHAREEFARRRRVEALGRSLWVASPEDTVLSKLVRFRKGDEVSGRQIEDARDVLKCQSPGLDDAYLDRWAADLGVSDLLARIRKA